MLINDEAITMAQSEVAYMAIWECQWVLDSFCAEGVFTEGLTLSKRVKSGWEQHF